MATFRDVYNRMCEILMEPGGLQLGLVTDEQTIDVINDAITDFHQTSGMWQDLYFEQALTFIPQYELNNTTMRPLAVFYDRKFLPQTDAFSLDVMAQPWQDDTEEPERWHQDRLPTRTIELVPAPSDSGLDLPETPTLDNAVGNVLVIASRSADYSGATLDTPIEGIPDSFAKAYLHYGALWKIFTGNNELKDESRARYCKARFDEGLALAATIMGEAIGE